MAWLRPYPHQLLKQEKCRNKSKPEMLSPSYPQDKLPGGSYSE